MTAPVRRAGEGRLGDGSTATWTVAEGTKGRRWREVVVGEGRIVHSLLLETFPDRRFAHLELATPTGLLTLHPEGDGTLHGNAVTAAGVHHVRGLDWPVSAVVLVESSPIAAAAARWLHRDAGSSDGLELPVLRISRELVLARASFRVVLDGRGRWQLDGVAVGIDPNGLPLLEDGRSWPLEEGGVEPPTVV